MHRAQRSTDLVSSLLPFLFAGLSAILLGACTRDESASQIDTKPSAITDAKASVPYQAPGANVILISVDTLRPDRMSLYGYERPTSPYLEELAEESVVFDRFYHNGGGTLPSHMTMMTSLRPASHRIIGSERILESERITLAERMRDAGYGTGGFVDGGWVRGRFGFDQGFDIYDDSAGHLAAILPKVRGWLSEAKDDGFFLFIHTYDVHSQTQGLPYHCPDGSHTRYATPPEGFLDGCRDGLCATRYLKEINSDVLEGEGRLSDHLTPRELEYVSDLYDGCINYVDNEIRDFFTWLKENSLYDGSLIIITSDHGEQFGEHGSLLHRLGGYEEISRIPLLMKLPNGTFSGERIEHLAAMVDLMPTVLDILALDEEPQAQGKSLVPMVTSKQAQREQVSINSSLRTEHWKYLARREQLFDLTADPQEQINLLDERPEIGAQLGREIQKLLKSDREEYDEFQKKVTASSPMNLTEEEQANLRALGYLD